jgi:hypothetical protein
VSQVQFRHVALLGLATLVLHLLLIQPNHPAALTWGALRLFPLELPVIILALLAAGPGWPSRILRVSFTALIVVTMVLKSADFMMFTALSRSFNPVADLPLVEALVRLLIGAVGPFLAVLAVLGAILVVGLVGYATWWATGRWAKITLPARPRVVAGLAALVATAVAIAEIGHSMRSWRLDVVPPGSAFTARVAVERARIGVRTVAELRDFQVAASTDAFAGRDDLLDLIDRDVIIIFVESYGRTSLDTPLYAPTHRRTLEEAQERLAERGLSMRSGFLAAPTRGGQSWLSHATLANGLWIGDQVRYRAALLSGRQTLFHLAGRSGFHTAAIMPQITLEWPESAYMGFETIYAARDLGYQGLPFNWVTMPDQFTLSAFDRLMFDLPREEPLFVQIALSSSHAPWVPVPELIDWDDVGDGSVFNEMAQSGDTPEVVWRDRDRVRDQYRQAIDYSLRTVFDYAARHADWPPLMIVIGDHQAAGFVALEERPDVPVHVIGPDDLVSRVAEWDFTPGLLPPDDAQAVPMSMMRDMILNTFTSASAGAGQP